MGLIQRLAFAQDGAAVIVADATGIRRLSINGRGHIDVCGDGTHVYVVSRYAHRTIMFEIFGQRGKIGEVEASQAEIRALTGVRLDRVTALIAKLQEIFNV